MSNFRSSRKRRSGGRRLEHRPLRCNTLRGVATLPALGATQIVAKIGKIRSFRAKTMAELEAFFNAEVGPKTPPIHHSPHAPLAIRRPRACTR